MKIRIIQGVYGFVNKAGSIEPKSSKDGIFEINDAEGKRLITLGVAEKGDEKVETATKEAVATEKVAEKAITEEEEKPEAEEIQSYEDMAYNDLKHLAKERGVDPMGKKEDIIARLKDDAPVLSAAEAE
jgi:hypothetical protein